jgi:hypothetical protein
MDSDTPNRIYLLVRDEDGEIPDEVMWCVDRIHDTDVEYIPASELQHTLAELIAENTRLSAEYQDAADAICAALGVEWTPACGGRAGNRYPTVAVEAIRDLREELKLNTSMLAHQCDLSATQAGLAREAEADAKMCGELLAGRGREVVELRQELAREKMRAATRGGKGA